MYSNHNPAPSFGSPSHFSAWNAFVRLVIETTVNSYYVMRQDGRLKKDLEEDAFSAILAEDYFCPLAHRNNLSLLAVPQYPVYSEEMKLGKKSTRKAPRIDIKIITFSSLDIYFTWECKRVCENQHVQDRDTSENSYLTRNYSVHGITRFIDENYSANLPDAGMIGYVLDGEIDTIVNEINNSMLTHQKNRTWTPDDALYKIDPIGKFSDVFESRHIRPKSQNGIRLFHLFFTFDWE